MSLPIAAFDVLEIIPLQLNESRSIEDKKRDFHRKPQQVLSFLGVQPGMSVLEILSSGGYYTEILSKAVGISGRVHAHNNDYILKVMEGKIADEFNARTANNRLPNVTHHKQELDDISEMEIKESVDMATIFLNYHDLYAMMSKPKRMAVLMQISNNIRPGGVLGVIDMEAGVGENNPELHRIHHQIVRDELKELGFVLHSEGHFLKNPTDNYADSVFSPGIRGKADRFIFKFIKPSEE